LLTSLRRKLNLFLLTVVLNSLVTAHPAGQLA